MATDHRRACRVLGLALDASAEDVKTAYLDLARVWHPDRFQHDERLRRKAEANLQRINEAYEFLRTAGPAPPPTVVQRLSSTFQAVLGLGDVRSSSAVAEPPEAVVSAPAGPVGTSRRSIWVLGLDAARAVRARRRQGMRRWWLVFAVLGLMLGGILFMLFTR